MATTRYEQDYYNDVSKIEKSLKRIADALENSNVKNVHLNTGCSLDPDNLVNEMLPKAEHDAAVNETFKAEEQEETDIQHDYLHGLVQDLDNNAYQEFCNAHCLRANDAVEVSNYITDLDYDEVLGIIKELEEKSDDQANEDAIKSQEDYPIANGVTYDDDYDLRVTAKMYDGELQHGHFSTKKECILDYVTNEFGSQGARYTDIIKFAFYLNDHSGVKFDSTRDRGYYSMGISGRRPHLTTGGNDYLVKGINKEGNERYFALSHVESVTEYWKHI